MTSDTDNQPRRRPPTIDLTATEVGETSSSARHDHIDPEQPSSTPRAATTAGRYIAWALCAAVLGIALAALWLYGPRHQDLPSSDAAAADTQRLDAMSARLDKIEAALGDQQPDAAAQRVAALEAATKSTADALRPLSGRLDALSARVDKIDAALSARSPDADLTSRVASLEGATKSTADALSALGRRVDQTAATAQGALAQANSAAGTADAAKIAAQDDAQRSDVGALTARVTKLETATQSLAASVTRERASADDHAARLAIAATTLRSAVERGRPYQQELSAVNSLGVGPQATAPLDTFAASGVPTVAQLAQGLSALGPSLSQASGSAPDDTTYLDRLKAGAQRLVHVTPINAPPGNDPSDVIARINVHAAHDDIADARADIANLPASAQAIAAPWVAKAEARDSAIAAAQHIEADALAGLGKASPQ